VTSSSPRSSTGLGPNNEAPRVGRQGQRGGQRKGNRTASRLIALRSSPARLTTCFANPRRATHQHHDAGPVHAARPPCTAASARSALPARPCARSLAEPERRAARPAGPGADRPPAEGGGGAPRGMPQGARRGVEARRSLRPLEGSWIRRRKSWWLGQCCLWQWRQWVPCRWVLSHLSEGGHPRQPVRHWLAAGRFHPGAGRSPTAKRLEYSVLLQERQPSRLEGAPGLLPEKRMVAAVAVGWRGARGERAARHGRPCRPGRPRGRRPPGGVVAEEPKQEARQKVHQTFRAFASNCRSNHTKIIMRGPASRAGQDRPAGQRSRRGGHLVEWARRAVHLAQARSARRAKGTALAEGAVG